MTDSDFDIEEENLLYDGKQGKRGKLLIFYLKFESILNKLW